MKSISKWRNGYALLFAFSLCLTVWHGITFTPEAVFILVVPSAFIIMTGCKMKKILMKPSYLPLVSS